MRSDEATKRLGDFIADGLSLDLNKAAELNSLILEFREAILQEAKEDAIEEINRRVYSSSLKSHI